MYPGAGPSFQIQEDLLFLNEILDETFDDELFENEPDKSPYRLFEAGPEKILGELLNEQLCQLAQRAENMDKKTLKSLMENMSDEERGRIKRLYKRKNQPQNLNISKIHTFKDAKACFEDIKWDLIAQKFQSSGYNFREEDIKAHIQVEFEPGLRTGNFSPLEEQEIVSLLQIQKDLRNTIDYETVAKKMAQFLKKSKEPLPHKRTAKNMEFYSISSKLRVYGWTEVNVPILIIMWF